jgi:hypothetical protein
MINPVKEKLRRWSDEGLDYRSFDYTEGFGWTGTEAVALGGGRIHNDGIWRKQYKGHGVTMRPYEDNEPRKSWEICQCSWANGGVQNVQLYENKLWKCPPIAYLKDAVTKFGLQTHPKWKPYLKYKPLSGDVNFEEMVNWMRREEEDVCNMCPAYDDKREKVLDKDVFGERRYT